MVLACLVCPWFFLNNWETSSHIVPVGQEFKSSLVGWLWFLMRLWLRDWLWVQKFEVFIGAGGSTSKVAHLHDWQLSVTVGEKPQFLTTGIVHRAVWVSLVTWQLAFHSVSNPRESKAEITMSFMFKTQVTDCHFFSVLLVSQVSPIHCGRGQYKSVNTREQGSLGATLEAVCHNQGEWLV